MTRRDRTMMLAALEMLREGALRDWTHGDKEDTAEAAEHMLRCGADACHEVLVEWSDARRRIAREAYGTHPAWWEDRQLREACARLATYLRARLRAEAVERYDAWADDAPHESPRWRGPVCAGCAEHLPGYGVGDTTDAPCPKTGKRELARQCRTLWEQAAQWWATHERPGGGR